MHRRHLKLAAIALLFVAGAIGQARADQPPATYPDANGYQQSGPLPGGNAAAPQPRQQRFGCYATHLGFGCSNFRSNMIFIFGSCRSFYGEACIKGPPPPYPPGVGQAGYDQAGGRGCGCR